MNPFGQLSINTTKGQAAMAAGVASFRGNKEFSVWAQTGVIVDRDNLIIDGDGVAPIGTNFEFVDYSTDSTFDILTFWNNTDAEINQVLASHTFVVGDYVVVESEIARVISVSGDTVGFQRGVAGTTNAAHVTGTDPIEYHSGVALVAGAVTVPMIAATAEEAIDNMVAIVAERYWLGRTGTASPHGFRWEILKLSAARALILSTVVGERLALFSDAGMSNATALPAIGQNGSSHQSIPTHVVWRAPTAAEVTDGNIVIPCPFKPISATVLVFTDAVAGSLVAWDGGTTYDHVANVVTLDNGAAVDWTATTFVSVVILGEPQDPDVLVGE